MRRHYTGESTTARFEEIEFQSLCDCFCRATRQGHLSAVVLLMSAGADPSLRDAEGCSCIHLAAQFGHTALVAYFIARGVNPDLQDRGGMTALMWAAWKVCALDPVRLLLTLGANPSLVDQSHGNTALHWAILARNTTAISTLIIKVWKPHAW